MLTLAPGDLLHHDAAGAAMDAPHPVEKGNQYSPEGDEVKAPLGQMVITRRRPMASRTDRRRALPRPQAHFDALLVILIFYTMSAEVIHSRLVAILKTA